jgi:hypothetical protein
MIRLTVEDAKDSEEEDETEISTEEQADALEQYWMYTKNLASLIFYIDFI